MSSRLALLIAVAALAGCPKGKTPPARTAMVQIPGGSFLMGLPLDAFPVCGDSSTPEIQHCDADSAALQLADWLHAHSWAPRARATIGDFEIDEHEVTNAQYRYCVEAGGCTPPAQGDVQGVGYYGEAAYDDSPVVWVTREQAQAYCEWLGLSLPTEAQWERAARAAKDPATGGALKDPAHPAEDLMQTYPWDGANDGNCVGGAFYAVYSHCVTTPQPVTYSEGDKTSFGVRNMASNVAEWVADDWSDLAYVAGDPRGVDVTSDQDVDKRCDPSPCDTGEACVPWCTDTSVVCYSEGTYSLNQGGGGQVLRGGSFLRSQCWLRLYVRQQAIQPASEDVGFRCAR
jgi:formylglycine-generating enzyme required for sulfatase activity